MNQEFFKPPQKVARTPAAAGLAYEEMAIRIEGSALRAPRKGRTLEGWYVPATGEGKHEAAVLIFHGAGGTIADWIPLLQYFASHGVAAMVFDYSAYGNSTGERDYSHLTRDGEAALQVFLRKSGSGVRHYALGHSLGTGVLLEALREKPIKLDGAVLISGWDSWRGWLGATDRVPWWAIGLLPDVFNSRDNLAHTTLPVLIIHGAEDKLIPADEARNLFRTAGKRGELRIVEGMGHQIPLTGELDGFWRPVLDFMREQKTTLPK